MLRNKCKIIQTITRTMTIHKNNKKKFLTMPLDGYSDKTKLLCYILFYVYTTRELSLLLNYSQAALTLNDI